MRNHSIIFTAITFMLSSNAMADSQTDWSGGPGVVGPVENWGTKFQQARNVSWREQGRVSLTGKVLDTPIKEVVTDDAGMIASISGVDINGDGVTDTVYADGAVTGTNTGRVYWEERNGPGDWTQHVVDADFPSGYYANGADIDGDGDMDIYAFAPSGYYDYPINATPSWRNGRFAWFENRDGRGITWEKHIIATGFWGANSMDVADLDGDGDMDFVGTSGLTSGVDAQDSDLTWFENVDGQGMQWIIHSLLDLDNSLSDAITADLDGDSDNDILFSYRNTFGWYENDGKGNFVQHIISSDLYGPPKLDAGDIDGDGDKDIMVVSDRETILRWWENVDGKAGLWQEHVIIYNLNNPHQVTLVDLDGDNDLDALVSRYFSSDYRFGAVYWFENTGGDDTSWSVHTLDTFLQWRTWATYGDFSGSGLTEVMVLQSDSSRSENDDLSLYQILSVEPQGELSSSIIKAPSPITPLFWNSLQPSGTRLNVMVRSGFDPLSMGNYVSLNQSGQDLNGLIDINAPYFQYQLQLETTLGSASPTVNYVGFTEQVLPGGGGSGGEPLPNQAPTAEAGSTQVVFASQTVTLSGANSIDPDGKIISYAWKQLSGRSVSLINADQVITTFKAPRIKRDSVSELLFELTVTDDKGATSTDTVKVSVVR